MVSVCIAAYNGEKFIEKQLLSIKNQTKKVQEVIICDDNSTDNTVEICQKFIKENCLDGWQVVKNQKNLGYCLNFFGAIEKATGDIIFLCDQDDEWYENKVETMCKTLQSNPEIKVLSSRYDIIDENSQIIENSGITYLGERFDNSLDFITVESLIGCSYIRGFATCFRAEVKKYLKPIDVKSLLAHDWFINIVGAIIGKSAVLNTKLCKYRYHQNNVSLSDMTRTTFLGDRQKRVDGLKESITAHSYLLSLELLKNDRKNIESFVKFEEKRLKFLQTKNPFVWLLLVFGIKNYSRYYKSFKGAFRVFLGDFCYAYNINFTK